MASKKKSNLWIWIMLGVIALLIGAVIMKNKGRETGEKVTAEACGE